MRIVLFKLIYRSSVSLPPFHCICLSVGVLEEVYIICMHMTLWNENYITPGSRSIFKVKSFFILYGANGTMYLNHLKAFHCFRSILCHVLPVPTTTVTITNTAMYSCRIFAFSCIEDPYVFSSGVREEYLSSLFEAGGLLSNTRFQGWPNWMVPDSCKGI